MSHLCGLLIFWSYRPTHLCTDGKLFILAYVHSHTTRYDTDRLDKRSRSPPETTPAITSSVPSQEGASASYIANGRSTPTAVVGGVSLPSIAPHCRVGGSDGPALASSMVPVTERRTPMTHHGWRALEGNLPALRAVSFNLQYTGRFSGRYPLFAQVDKPDVIMWREGALRAWR